MSKPRPKVLFLAHPFPPLRNTACARTWNIAKFLMRVGWDVTVVTPHFSLWRHVDSAGETDRNLEREGIRRILTGHQWRSLNPGNLNCRNRGPAWFMGGVCRKVARRFDIDRATGWIKAAEHACSTLTSNDVDVILATGEPFASFKLAKRLSDTLGRPYVLDYRDPWTGNPHASCPARASTIREEARLLAASSAVTIVSPSWASVMDRSFGVGHKLHVVTNGFDPEEFVGVKPYKFGHFAIVYAGSFYPPKRVISPVMAALCRVKVTKTGRKCYFHYYGDEKNHVYEEAKRFGVVDHVVVHGNVRREEVLSAVRGAGVSVVITSVNDEGTAGDKGIVPAKVFENIGLGTPILLIAPSGSDIETIAKITGLAGSFTATNINGIASFLADAMCGRVPKPKNPGAYAWTNLINELSTTLHDAIRKHDGLSTVNEMPRNHYDEKRTGLRAEDNSDWDRRHAERGTGGFS